MTQISVPLPRENALASWEPLQPSLTYSHDVESSAEQHESLIRHYWRIAYRRRWLIGLIVAACVALALVLSMLSQRQYTATTRIQVAREEAKVIDIEAVASEETSAPSQEFYQTQYALLKSRSLAEAVVGSLGLTQNMMFLAGFDASEVDNVQELSRDERFKLATEMVMDNTAISPIRLSSIVDIQVELADPVLAARIANELAEKFIEMNLSRRYEATSYARQFLQNRLNSVRAKLEDSERRATAYARAQGLISIGSSNSSGEATQQQSLATAQLAQLSSELALARANRERAEGKYRANTGGSAAERSLTTTAVNELRQQRASLRGELRKLESDFGPAYPQVKALREQLAELDRQVAQEEGVVRSGVDRELYDQFRQALATEQGLQQRVDQLKSAALDDQQRAIRLNIIQRDVDTNRALYEALLQRFKEIGVAGGIGTNNVSIVDEALPPELPSSPNLPLNLALGLIVGLSLGAAAAIASEQLAESVILPAEFQRKLGVPLLGSTPVLQEDSKKKLAASGRALVGQGATAIQSASELDEAYFSVLTALQFSTASGAPKTLAVTSTQPGEGKSTTALALARTLASVGTRVLLIDADMRNPSLHKSLNIATGRGLSELLTGKAALNDVSQWSERHQFHFVTAGQLPPNPAELLASGAFPKVLSAAAAEFEHVVIDGPPVLGLADAPLIARAAEGTLFVVESGRTRATQARQAIDRLIQVRAHLIGAVLTKLNSRDSGYGYGYGYNYSYGDGGS